MRSLGKDRQDVRTALPVRPPPRAEQAEALLRRGARREPVGEDIRRLRPGFRDRAVEGVAGGLVAQGAAEQDDLLDLLLDLAEALQERHRPREVLDADPEQRQGRDLQKLGQPPHRVELDDLALLVPVQGGARDAEPRRDLLRAQSRFEAIGPQLLSDVGELHPSLRSLGRLPTEARF